MSELQKEFEKYEKQYNEQLQAKFADGCRHLVVAKTRYHGYDDEWTEWTYYRAESLDEFLGACVAFLVVLRGKGYFEKPKDPPEGPPTPWEEIDKIPRGPERKKAEWARERYDSELAQHERSSFVHEVCEGAISRRDGFAAYTLVSRYLPSFSHIDFDIEDFERV